MHDETMQERADRWASTMGGTRPALLDGVRLAHTDSSAAASGPVDRTARQAAEHELLCATATRAVGAGHRARAEKPDEWRTCFERDRDRILHASAFRRLAANKNHEFGFD